MNKTRYSAVIPTSEGDFTATYSEKGLCGLSFPLRLTNSAEAGENNPASSSLVSACAANWPSQVRRWHSRTARALHQVLAGRPAKVLPPFDVSEGTKFQRAVWDGMSRIRRGQSISYGDLAKALGRPGATRAVGNACGANPVPVLIPCHRVLAAKGKLGGFSGGLHWKRLLLEREGLRCD